MQKGALELGNDAVVLDSVSKTIRGRRVLDNVSIRLKRQGIYGFSGPNGSGKTMLFRAIAGLIRVDSGEIWVNGERVGRDGAFAQDIGVVIEHVEMWKGLTARENLELLSSIRRVAGPAEIEKALDRVELDPEDRRACEKFSLGMKQRLALAQAIMESPSVLLLDEPTGALDRDGQRMVKDLVIEQKAAGTTLLIISHEQGFLDAVCDTQFVVEDGVVREVDQ